MSVACGIAVANIYYNQPMLGVIERDFPDAPHATSLIPTATQLGYAAGLFLLVPLGDLIARRLLIVVQFVALAAALVAAALAPTAWALVGASLLVGATASVAQQIIPFAASLAEPARRGATIGSIMSGLLCGLLLGRAFAGFIADHFGWRAVFWIGMGLALAMAVLLRARLPSVAPVTRLHYASLIRSLGILWRAEPTLRRATLVQAFLFAAFSALWTVLALLLEQPRYGLGAGAAGAFGLVGVAGILVAPIAGRLADRRGPRFGVGVGAATMLLAWLVLGLWNDLAGLVAGVLLLDFAQQGSLVSNQHLIYALRADAQSRVNMLFMSLMFVGGAVGSAGAMTAWAQGGWPLVSIYGGALSAAALAAHLLRRN
jgi:predicted MFS family arabinose efflux permease